MLSEVEVIRAPLIGEVNRGVLEPGWHYRVDPVEKEASNEVGGEIKVYILDTSVLLDLLQESKAAWCKLYELDEEGAILCISEVSAHELLKNVYLSQKSERLRDIEMILELLAVLPMTKDSSSILRALSTQLFFRCKSLRYHDAVTAAIALDTGGIIVTRGNNFDFMPELKVISY